MFTVDTMHLDNKAGKITGDGGKAQQDNMNRTCVCVEDGIADDYKKRDQGIRLGSPGILEK
jgi:hypothetical protein